jgi:glycosyltransferase involved in cell wall biosynthesis
MNIHIITCFQPYEERVDSIANYLKSKGHKVLVISSNFKHISKEFRKDTKEGYYFVNTKPYRKNFSFARIYSHYLFSKKASKFSQQNQPDLIYAVIPPNFLTLFTRNIKRIKRDMILIYDVMDLWPETFPVKWVKYSLPYLMWKRLRNVNLKYANYIITECDLFYEGLKKYVKNIQHSTIYLTKEENKSNVIASISDSVINICYLGSVNNIIDISFIVRLLGSITKFKKCVFHIIGAGENLDLLISSVEQVDIDVVYHGKLYGQEDKQEVFNFCNFGLNIMKSEVCVGLTMKSLDYFHGGLPIINNIPADTYELVNEYNCGINIDAGNFNEVIEKIAKLGISENVNMRNNALRLFEDKFSMRAFENKMDELLDRIEFI